MFRYGLEIDNKVKQVYIRLMKFDDEKREWVKMDTWRLRPATLIATLIRDDLVEHVKNDFEL